MQNSSINGRKISIFNNLDFIILTTDSAVSFDMVNKV